MTMRFYFAPLEGVTGYIYRNAHRRFYAPADKYFMPFVSPNQHHVFTRRELAEVSPAHNDVETCVPQLMTKCARDFIWAAGALHAMGYREVNLNLGCPSGTVTAKGKGAGFLAAPDALDAFFAEIFSAVDIRVSVKTRLGFAEEEEFDRLVEIFNRYPIAELIVHPRVRADFYKGAPRLDAFSRALSAIRAPVCYNGDIVTPEENAALHARLDTVQTVMIGRGLVANPALLSQIRGGGAADARTLRAFHDALYEGYCEAFGSRRSAVLRMKELWFYMICLFDAGEACAKQIRRAADAPAYEAAVDGVFRTLNLRESARPDWRQP